MKKITFLIALMISSLGFAQNLITNGDFESGSTGWSGNAVNVVTVSGNSYNSANVAVAGNPWDANISYVVPMTTSGTTYKLTFQAWTDTNRTLIAGIGLNVDPWTSVVQTVNLTSTPTTFVLNLTSNFANANSRIIFDMGNAVGAVNIDNVILETIVTTCNNGVQDGDETGIDCGGTVCSPCVPVPTVAAPTPPNRLAADVKSIFSDVYAPIAVLNYAGVDNEPSNDNTFNTSWSPANTTLVQIAGDNTNKITGLGFEGIAFLGSRIDATTFTTLHIDIWTPTATLDKSFNLKLVNFNGGSAEVNAIEKSLTNASTPVLPNPNPGAWISYEIPLSTFTIAGGGSLSRNDLAQLVITSDLGTVYYDNLYFHKGTLGTASFEKSNIKMYPNPVKNTLNIEANSSINKVLIYNILGQEVLSATPKSNSATLLTSELQKGVYMITTDIDGTISTSKFLKE